MFYVFMVFKKRTTCSVHPTMIFSYYLRKTSNYESIETQVSSKSFLLDLYYEHIFSLPRSNKDIAYFYTVFIVHFYTYITNISHQRRHYFYVETLLRHSTPNHPTCFDANASSSGVYSFTTFTRLHVSP
jgi:hypothetical protein